MPDTQLAVAYDRSEQQVRKVYTDGNVQVLNARRQTHTLIGVRLCFGEPTAGPTLRFFPSPSLLFAAGPWGV